MVKHLSANAEDMGQSLGQGDSLERELATHSSNLAWEIPWTEEPGRLQSMGLQRAGHDGAHTHLVNTQHYVTFSVRRSD